MTLSLPSGLDLVSLNLVQFPVYLVGFKAADGIKYEFYLPMYSKISRKFPWAKELSFGPVSASFDTVFKTELLEAISLNSMLEKEILDGSSVAVFTKVQAKAKEDKDIHLLLLPPFSDREINALQKASSVVLQKSLREGFALTVSEALWKGVPVIGGNTGGIPLQIIDGVNGFLVNDVGEAADRINYLLKNPQIAREMGRKGKEHVRKNFLIVRELRDYFLLFLTLLHIPGKLIQL
jgi:glycosyltransferase involved in cell wall biosynthesis